MFIRRVARFRPARSSDRKSSFWRSLQLRFGTVLLTIAMLAVAFVLYQAPYKFQDDEVKTIQQALSTTYQPEIGKLEQRWLSFPTVPIFTQGNEPEIRNLLANDPLLVALGDRRDPSKLWVRDRDRLIKAPENMQSHQFRHWITQAEYDVHRLQWFPGPDENRDPALGPSILLRSDDWICIRRWTPGSRAVEEMLRLAFGKDPILRAGLVLQNSTKQTAVFYDWGAEPNLQVDPARIEQSFFRVPLTAQSFDEWYLYAVPFHSQEEVLIRRANRAYMMGAIGSLLVGASMGLGLWLRYRARQQAVLNADRMAGLTHSLKTPLAVLKFRCDTIRLGRLSQDQADAELMKLGEEVDHLTHLIENGLQAIRGVRESGPQELVTPGWLEDVATDLIAAFEADDRKLELQLAKENGKASLSSLRTALLTLLENALFHGDGKVRMQSQKVRNRLQIRVSDEGLGLNKVQLNAIGKPFLRLRNQGREGFEREGQGLGVSLLCQVAQREGWGLTFASAPNHGFVAIIEIRCA